MLFSFSKCAEWTCPHFTDEKTETEANSLLQIQFLIDNWGRFYLDLFHSSSKAHGLEL